MNNPHRTRLTVAVECTQVVGIPIGTMDYQQRSVRVSMTVKPKASVRALRLKEVRHSQDPSSRKHVADRRGLWGADRIDTGLGLPGSTGYRDGSRDPG